MSLYSSSEKPVSNETVPKAGASLAVVMLMPSIRVAALKALEKPLLVLSVELPLVSEVSELSTNRSVKAPGVPL
jgi:hypothetical protein